MVKLISHVENMNSELKSMFVVSSPRSGSTALAKLLGSADELCVAVEPEPNFNRENGLCRILPDRESIRDLGRFVCEELRKRVASAGGKDIYVEKSVSLAPFIGDIVANIKGARFVYLHRDGRDVVSSCFNWHRSHFGNFYRELGFDWQGSEEMRQTLARSRVELDTNDFSRFRSQDWLQSMMGVTSNERFEALARMWVQINEEYAEGFSNIESGRVLNFSSTRAGEVEIEELERFCSANFSPAATASFLRGGGNSVKDRGFDSGFSDFPPWTEWDSGMRQAFEEIAGPRMTELGYWKTKEPTKNWKTREYGDFWRSKAADEEWFTWMYKSRISAHRDLEAFVRQCNEGGEGLKKVAEVGPGIGIGYRDLFKDVEYHGFEVTKSCVDWFNESNENPRHAFHHADVLEKDVTPLKLCYDLVFSQGTIDNTYDVDRYLLRMCEMSKRWVYVTCYRGWFPYLDEHRYRYDKAQGCFYNDISPSRLKKSLIESGISENSIWIEPLRNEDGAVPFQTRILIDTKS